MSSNADVAALFDEYADILEASGDEWRPRSYRRAAENIRNHPDSVVELAADGPEALKAIEGVGDSIAEKIVELERTGRVETIEEARDALPVDMDALLRVEGVGPKTVGELYDELGITTLDELEAAAEEGRIRELDGYGARTEENILENVGFARQAGQRRLLGEARPIAEAVLAHLGASPAVDACDAAGSLRRWRDTIGDVDVLAAGKEGEAVVDRFRDWERVDSTIEAGSTKASVRASGLRIDLRVVDPSEWGSALQYFTGSKEHNVRLRSYALRRDLKVNEYGVFDVTDVDDPSAGQRVGDRIAGETEEGVYAALGLAPIPAELREDTGEIDAAAADELPDLLEEADLRGDLHVHTDWSDGDETIEEIVDGASAFGHDYLCISDHASGPGVVGGMGLEDDEIIDQVEVVRGIASTASIDVFAGIEANIDDDGGISVGDAALDALDLVIASPHSGLGGDGTRRLCAAAAHPAVDVIGHPSGRLLNRRPGFEVDVAELAAVAAEHGTALEVNANPRRLDLWGEAVRTAIGAGATIAINTDAHRSSEFEFARYGVHTARRGWAEPADVLNTGDADAVRAFIE